MIRKQAKIERNNTSYNNVNLYTTSYLLTFFSLICLWWQQSCWSLWRHFNSGEEPLHRHLHCQRPPWEVVLWHCTWKCVICGGCTLWVPSPNSLSIFSSNFDSSAIEDVHCCDTKKEIWYWGVIQVAGWLTSRCNNLGTWWLGQYHSFLPIEV